MEDQPVQQVQPVKSIKDYSNSDLYVSDPVVNKDTITSYVTYNLKGKIITEILVRRYRDFHALRVKLMENWPGVYIPNIPHKQAVGANNKDVVDMRMEQINRFLCKLSKIPYLFNSEELSQFLKDNQDTQKIMNSMPVQTYEEILNRYHKTFFDYNENFDVNQAKANLARFLQVLRNSLPKIKEFRDLVKAERDSFQAKIERLRLIIDSLALFEEHNLLSLCNNDDKKLIFRNEINQNLIQIISEVNDKYHNPFDKFYDCIAEDCLDVEAMIEAFVTLNNLQEVYEKITKNFSACSAQLTDVQAGKTNIKSVFSFKSKEKEIESLLKEKETLEKNIESLGEVIKIATFNMDSEVNKYRSVCLDVYYKELKQIQKTSRDNCKYMNTLWTTLANNPNLQDV